MSKTVNNGFAFHYYLSLQCVSKPQRVSHQMFFFTEHDQILTDFWNSFAATHNLKKNWNKPTVK